MASSSGTENGMGPPAGQVRGGPEISLTVFRLSRRKGPPGSSRHSISVPPCSQVHTRRIFHRKRTFENQIHRMKTALGYQGQSQAKPPLEDSRLTLSHSRVSVSLALSHAHTLRYTVPGPVPAPHVAPCQLGYLIPNLPDLAKITTIPFLVTTLLVLLSSNCTSYLRLYSF
jgi:hypothetical protein